MKMVVELKGGPKIEWSYACLEPPNLKIQNYRDDKQTVLIIFIYMFCGYLGFLKARYYRMKKNASFSFIRCMQWFKC